MERSGDKKEGVYVGLGEERRERVQIECMEGFEWRGSVVDVGIGERERDRSGGEYRVSLWRGFWNGEASVCKEISERVQSECMEGFEWSGVGVSEEKSESAWIGLIGERVQSECMEGFLEWRERSECIGIGEEISERYSECMFCGVEWRGVHEVYVGFEEMREVQSE
ncbi:unnamed protein product [Mytilus edulis]|uniref:Uncharacterized protein n=1 Tax=Mytilus edulis TaxID=6550 RepID=A0A8S3SIR2_MYTED|nr:unnamed protein product [Mytilus edulis]